MIVLLIFVVPLGVFIYLESNAGKTIAKETFVWYNILSERIKFKLTTGVENKLWISLLLAVL